METNTKLHHCCITIVTNSLEHIIEMFDILGCIVKYRPKDEFKWAMVGQPELPFSIQISESSEMPVFNIEVKRKTHVAFLSDNPRELIEKVAEWSKGSNIKFAQGGWSEKELYFDLPDLFINFVIEIMHTSIADIKE